MHNPDAPSPSQEDWGESTHSALGLGLDLSKDEIGDDSSLEPAQKLAADVQRILGKRKIVIDKLEALEYAKALLESSENTLVRVKGRHRALKRNKAGVISSVEWRPAGNAAQMRVSNVSGPMTEEDSSMVMEGMRPLTGVMLCQDVTIDAAMLHDIPDRKSLGNVMGGSAAQLSDIQNSEWLHAIAHSLGGPDADGNIVAGPHSLNTAMIPFEACVRNAARKGDFVNYRVIFFSGMEGTGDVRICYVHHVQISIALANGKSGTWTLEVSDRQRDQFINAHVLDDIKKGIEDFENSV